MMVRDAVCGMMVSEQHAGDKKLTTTFGGKTYAFCSKTCKKKFEQNPQGFVQQSQVPAHRSTA
ncbi:MAG TPA: YHS domain-containing protein [Planctomycetota bacterium]|jgi:YHS domain-containing protein